MKMRISWLAVKVGVLLCTHNAVHPFGGIYILHVHHVVQCVPIIDPQLEEHPSFLHSTHRTRCLADSNMSAAPLATTPDMAPSLTLTIHGNPHT